MFILFFKFTITCVSPSLMSEINSVLDKVGCFSIPRRSVAPFGKKTPQSPEDIDTKFWLLTRDNPNQPQYLKYADDQVTLKSSHFNISRSTKFIAHGFKGSGKDKGALNIVEALLQLVSIYLGSVVVRHSASK